MYIATKNMESRLLNIKTFYCCQHILKCLLLFVCLCFFHLGYKVLQICLSSHDGVKLTVGQLRIAAVERINTR